MFKNIIPLSVFLVAFSLNGCQGNEDIIPTQADGGDINPSDASHGDIEYVVTEGLEGWAELVEQLRTEYSADFDQDGFNEVSFELDGDQEIVYIDTIAGENVFWAARSSNGNLDFLYDSNEDGQVDFQYNYTADDQTAIVLKDEDYDFYPETRITYQFISQDIGYQYTIETDSDKDSNYIIEHEGYFPYTQEALAPFQIKKTASPISKKAQSSNEPGSLVSKNICSEGTKKVFFGLPGVYIC